MNILQLISSYTNKNITTPNTSANTNIINSNNTNDSNQHSVSTLNVSKQPSLSILYFSKDRPYQLQQTIQSIHTNIILNTTIYHIILYSPGEYEYLYNLLQTKYPHITFINESTDGFYTSLQYCLNIIKEKSDLVLFTVDDLIVHTEYDISPLLSYLLSSTDTFCIQLKLHLGINYSHPSSTVNFPPYTTAIKSNYNNDFFLKYAIQSSTSANSASDWNYPIDFCGSIYRIQDILLLLTSTKDIYTVSNLNNPNKLEYYLNLTYQNMTSNVKYTATAMNQYKFILTSPYNLLNVVTINKVQTAYNVPIYKSNLSLHELNLLLLDTTLNTNYNLSRYATNMNNLSVHIGDVFFTTPPPLSTVLTSSSILYTKSSNIEVSIILPVYNNTNTVEEAILSIFSQENINNINIELIIINDGSTDNTSTVIQNIINQYNNKYKHINIIYLTTQHIGLIKVLQLGVYLAKGRYICRMDSDDICFPLRIFKQIIYLNNNHCINIIGSQAILIHDTTTSPTTTNTTRCFESYDLAVFPTHPLLVQFEMYFRCPLLHPSVMFRKTAIKECGAYLNCLHTFSESIEDYDLWMRVAHKYPFSLANLPDVLLQLRLSPSSKSSLHKEELCDASSKLRWKYISILINAEQYCIEHSIPIEEVEKCCSFITRPESITTIFDFELTMTLMELLYTNYITEYAINYKWSNEEEEEIVLKVLHATYIRKYTNIIKISIKKFNYKICEKYCLVINYTEAEYLKDCIINTLI